MTSIIKKFAEDHYWQELTVFRFLVVIAHGFEQGVVDPGGNFWRVKLQNIDDHLVLKYGWRECVQAHSVGEGDILYFEYDGNACVNVFILGKDKCERESTYLVRNNKNILTDMGDSIESVQKLPPPDNIEVHSQKQLAPPGFPVSNVETASNAPGAETCDRRRVARKTDIEDYPMASTENRHRHHSLNELQSNTSVRSSESSPACSEKSGSKSTDNGACADRRGKNAKGEGTSRRNAGHQGKPVLRSTRSKVILVSNRRRVTKEEKDRALQLANEAQPAKPFFRIVMRDSHVYKLHFLTIPGDFVAENNLLRWTTADLHVPGKEYTWHDVRLEHKSSGHNRTQCGLSGACWRDFVEDNFLEEGDVCTFELCGTENELIFHVHIFRVVDEVTLLTKTSLQY